MKRYRPAALEAAVTRIFAAAACDDDEAACVARHLVSSNLCGHDSHGVIRVTRYIDFMAEGTVKPGRHATTVVDVGAMAVLDGNMGFGQVICEEAMALLADKAKAHGIALVTLRNCGHAGRLGDWAETLAEHDLISLHFLNITGKGMMAMPFGGSDRRLSLNPLSVCVPVAGGEPLLLDMTTTVVAEGKLAVALNKGEEVAPGTIVDRDGHPTTQPKDFYDGGALLPIAGHKGSGLNVMIDLLCGGLSGGGCTRPDEDVLINTMTSIAIDPTGIVDREAYIAEVRRYADWVAGSPPADASRPVLLPGGAEQRTRAERARDGIPLDDETWGQIVAAGERVGVAADETAALAGAG